jgi:hypothetical protein
LIVIDKKVEDIANKMDKERDDIEEDIDNENKDQGFMNNDKKP